MAALILSLQEGLAGIFDLVGDVITQVTGEPLLMLGVCVGITGIAIGFFRGLVRG